MSKRDFSHGAYIRARRQSILLMPIDHQALRARTLRRAMYRPDSYLAAVKVVPAAGERAL